MGSHPALGRRVHLAPRPKATPMTGSRIPGLLVPAVFLLALVVGVCWYWRHRDDD
ncbi:hypothetical protein ACFZCP_19945 [Streptomyces sp. NPDC007971]|uniref:hypothetical protein n=1 Tax=unclassified Streptomyces TaxID=2593676 RepID=UPI0036ED3169